MKVGYIVIHSRNQRMDLSEPRTIEAHAFGPFDSPKAARDFIAQASDNCWKAIVMILDDNSLDEANLTNNGH